MLRAEKLPAQGKRKDSVSQPDPASALTAWRTLLGSGRTIDSVTATARYCDDTSGYGIPAAGALLVQEVAEIPRILEIARLHRVPLYPISTGRNWGYGRASPIVPGCVILDLSGLNRIIALDSNLGLVTLQPGVTQRQLRAHLDRHAPRFMVPTTGAGPDCSLVGNALERGYGITPHADHFASVMSLEAILPDGRLYRSALAERGAAIVNSGFKWGMGPYVDGLFSQGSLGIVTQMTIALAPRPERVEAFFFGIPEEGRLPAAVAAVQQLLRSLGGTIGSINLMNARRVLAMTTPYPAERAGPDGILPRDVVAELGRRHQIRPWMGVGALYGTGGMVKAARRIVRQQLGAVADRIVFMTPERSAMLGKIVRSVPGLRRHRISRIVTTLGQSMDLLEGRPGEVALPLAYWRSGQPPRDAPRDPARDGCGLIWYSPLVPMQTDAVTRFVALVTELCTAHGIEPLITLTSLTDRCFDSTIPLLFDRADPRQMARARACYDALFEAGERFGFVPYRLGVHAMQRVTGTPSVFWDVVGTMKSALDPDNIIAPGRYAPIRQDATSGSGIGAPD
jgi:4-cresol dehydrogenase (hydroxylating)